MSLPRRAPAQSTPAEPNLITASIVRRMNRNDQVERLLFPCVTQNRPALGETSNMGDTAIDVVKQAVKDLGHDLGYESLRDPVAETELFGGADGIDSLSLVRIVAEVERIAEEKFAKRIVLADDRAMSKRHSPFRTVGTLAALLAERLAE